MSRRIDRWRKAFESRDPSQVVALYGPEATHASGQVARVWPELGRSVLRGKEEIHEYLRRAFERFRELRFEILTLTETKSRSAVELLRHSNVERDDPAHVLELIEWRGEKIRSVRVFYF